MIYSEAVTYLESLINYERLSNYPYKTSMKLDRMRGFLAQIGNPHEQFPSLHVAGSKGKGSTCAFLYSILRAAGYRVGLYTSPHLVEVRERIRVCPSRRSQGAGREGGGSDWISEAEFAELVAWLRPRAEAFATQSSWGPLTYFEQLTAVAFEYFSRQHVDVVVLEVGLGGRLDATNVVAPRVCGIMPISLDHMAILGETITEIAREKAGILKAGIPAVLAPQPSEVGGVFRRVAEQVGAPLRWLGSDLRYAEESHDGFSQRFAVVTGQHRIEQLETALLGRHQLDNVTTAIGMVEVLREQGWRISDEAIRCGVAEAAWPGRMEVVRRRPTIMLDGAHNAASAQALADALLRHGMGKGVMLVLGMADDKDVRGMVRALVPLSRRVVVTRINSPRSLSPEHLRQEVLAVGNLPCVVTGNIEQALGAALSAAGSDEVIVVTGSLYLVGAVRRLLVGEGRTVSLQIDSSAPAVRLSNRAVC